MPYSSRLEYPVRIPALMPFSCTSPLGPSQSAPFRHTEGRSIFLGAGPQAHRFYFLQVPLYCRHWRYLDFDIDTPCVPASTATPLGVKRASSFVINPRRRTVPTTNGTELDRTRAAIFQELAVFAFLLFSESGRSVLSSSSSGHGGGGG